VPTPTQACHTSSAESGLRSKTELGVKPSMDVAALCSTDSQQPKRPASITARLANHHHDHHHHPSSPLAVLKRGSHNPLKLSSPPNSPHSFISKKPRTPLQTIHIRALARGWRVPIGDTPLGGTDPAENAHPECLPQTQDLGTPPRVAGLIGTRRRPSPQPPRSGLLGSLCGRQQHACHSRTAVLPVALSLNTASLVLALPTACHSP
ncbi:hypothetical protein GQ54DRAFT_295231, partial [Martensiomyces pterosporus]